MIKKIYYLNFIIFFSALFTAQSCSNEKPEENSLLWKISGNGLDKPSYLFGTHHLVPLSFLDSIPQWRAAFDETQQVVGEINMNSGMEMQMKIMAASLLPENVSYKSLVSNDDYALLDSTLNNLMGVGMSQFDQMKPAMISTLLSVLLYRQFYPSIEEGDAIDQYFQTEAEKLYRPVLALETVDDQIAALFDSQSLERQAELLMCTVKHPDYVKRQMDKMQTAFYAQDLEGMRKLFVEDSVDDPCPSTQEEKDTLNKNRNIRWADQLPDIMKEKSSFIAVGCLHLPGKDGLITLLREQGYTVEAVK